MTSTISFRTGLCILSKRTTRPNLAKTLSSVPTMPLSKRTIQNLLSKALLVLSKRTRPNSAVLCVHEASLQAHSPKPPLQSTPRHLVSSQPILSYDLSLLSSYCTTSSPRSQHLLSAAANELYCTTSSPSSHPTINQTYILSHDE